MWPPLIILVSRATTNSWGLVANTHLADAIRTGPSKYSHTNSHWWRHTMTRRIFADLICDETLAKRKRGWTQYSIEESKRSRTIIQFGSRGMDWGTWTPVPTLVFVDLVKGLISFTNRSIDTILHDISGSRCYRATTETPTGLRDPLGTPVIPMTCCNITKVRWPLWNNLYWGNTQENRLNTGITCGQRKVWRRRSPHIPDPSTPHAYKPHSTGTWFKPTTWQYNSSSPQTSTRYSSSRVLLRYLSL